MSWHVSREQTLHFLCATHCGNSCFPQHRIFCRQFFRRPVYLMDALPVRQMRHPKFKMPRIKFGSRRRKYCLACLSYGWLACLIMRHPKFEMPCAKFGSSRRKYCLARLYYSYLACPTDGASQVCNAPHQIWIEPQEILFGLPILWMPYLSDRCGIPSLKCPASNLDRAAGNIVRPAYIMDALPV